MNKNELKTNLALFFQTLPDISVDLELNFISNFSRLFFSFIAESQNKGLVYPVVNISKLQQLETSITEIFQQNLLGVGNLLLTSQEYSFKIGKSLDDIIELLPQFFILLPDEVANISTIILSSKLAQVLNPILSSSTSTSSDLSSMIVEEFIQKLNSSTIINNSGVSTNWNTN